MYNEIATDDPKTKAMQFKNTSTKQSDNFTLSMHRAQELHQLGEHLTTIYTINSIIITITSIVY